MTAAVRTRNDDRERQLVLAAIAGDRSSQQALMQGHRQHVHHTLFRILGSNRDMEDVMQETFIDIFRSLPGYRGDSSLRRWCATIATRTAWRHLDRQRRRPRGDASVDVADSAPSAAAQLDAERAVQRLYETLDRLEPTLRITFALAVIDEQPMSEVAALTGVSLMAAKTRLWRARAQLQKRAQRDPILVSYLRLLERGTP